MIKRLLRRYPAVTQGLMERPANYNRSLDELLELEADGRAYLLFPERMPIGNGERDVAKLRAMFAQGRRQGRRETDAIREFCGLS